MILDALPLAAGSQGIVFNKNEEPLQPHNLPLGKYQPRATVSNSS